MRKVLVSIAALLFLAGPAEAENSVKERMAEACKRIEHEQRKLNCYGYTLVMFRNRDYKNWEAMAYWLTLLRIMVPDIVEAEWNRD